MATAQPVEGVEAAADSLRLYDLGEETVVSAAKLPVRRTDMAASVTVLWGPSLAGASAQTLSEALARGAGLHVYDFAGNGMRPAVESRGFAAFGETSYLRFQVNGVPFGELADDAAPWSFFDLDQIERVEVIRSASSALHGNTAFTGVVNLVPVATEEPWAVRASLSGGSFDRREGTLTAGWRHERSRGTGSLSVRALDGWRDHSEWAGTTAFATLASSDEGHTRARLGVFHSDTEAELPGALPKTLLDVDPETASTPLDADDATRLHVVGVLESTPSAPVPFTSALYFQTEDRTLTETIIDTQREARETFIYGGQASVRLSTSTGSVEARLLAGAEGSFGKMTSAFREIRDSGDLGARLTDADVTRDQVAGHVRLEVDPVPRVTLAAGVRRDDIWADLTPTEDDSSGAVANDKIMNAWSPSASVNVRIGRASHVYAQVSRSFKTPTLTQLYELRPFPDGFGGTLTLSNSTLDPQRATQVEIGARAYLARWLSADVAAYTMKAEDEIGFDLSTFSYANIGASIHRGLEATVNATPLEGLELEVGHSLTIAEFDGDFAGAEVDGNQINNVPKYLSRASVRYAHRLFTLGASVLDVREQWADEANTVEIPDYTVLDVYGGVTLAGQEIFARVLNATDEMYTPAAFVSADPETFEPIALYYPAPGRRVEVGVRMALD